MIGIFREPICRFRPLLAAGVLCACAAQAGLDSNSTVFLIMMENHNWADIKGSPDAPYINNVLLPIAAHAEQCYNPPGIHPSLPNYLWLEAGDNFGILNDSRPAVNHQATTNHLVTQLAKAGISWRAYAEDIAGFTCPLTNDYPYAVRHVPFVYFDDVTSSNDPASPVCIAGVRPFAQLSGDLASNTTARYNFLTPNVCSDMHDSNANCPTTNAVLNGDTWLALNLPQILASPAYTNGGAVIITWDEGEGGSDGPIGMIVLSPFAKRGYSNSNHYDHGSTLRTMQKIFGVRPFLGDAANATDLSDLFFPDAIPNRDAFVLDGVADSTNYLRSTTNMCIWAAVKDQTLYVATWSPGNYPGDTNKSDHFVIVSDSLLPTATQSAFSAWFKHGSNAVLSTKPYIGGESMNGFAGWFNAPVGSRVAKSSDNSGVMEGTIDLGAAFGPGIMTGTIYIAAAAYGTTNGGGLVSQGPLTVTTNGNIDPNEFLALSVTSLVDRSHAFAAMTVAGTFNGWNPSLSNMLLVADDLWQFDALFTNASAVEFKFAANGSWTDNWGDNDQPDFTAPLSGTGEPFGANIVVSNALAGAFRFTFNDLALAYSLLPLDSVGDGLPDFWRAQYFGGIGTTTTAASCAACDPDADGFTNLQEYWLGTSPTNPLSGLVMIGANNAVPGTRLQWRSVGGKNYRVDFSDAITNGFVSLAVVPETNAPAGSETVSSFVDGPLTNRMRLYRVRLAP